VIKTDPRDDENVKNFYDVWLNFATSKQFSWADQWNLSEAPDRRTRRLMERDNKKAREDMRRDFNDAVRSLAKFVRKRDPRYKAHVAQQQNNTANSSVQPDSAAALRRGELAATYVDQDWQKLDRPTNDPDLEWAVAEDDDMEEWECVACGKSFRSEAAWDSHERSKKHMKEVERLKKEMGLEDDELGLAGDTHDLHLNEPTASHPSSAAESAEVIDRSVHDIPQPVPLTKSEKKMRDLFDETATQIPTSEPSTQSTVSKESKRDKRKDREAKKNEGEISHRCNVCSQLFDSKTKLFGHIRQTGHALASPIDGKSQQRRKGRS